jgi:hypothetical protein
LLSNEELLEEERTKAKNIRDKMSGVVGGMNYGGYGGESRGGMGGKYESYDSKNYGKSSDSGSYNNNTGGFGDYNYNKSTLDKYKDSNSSKVNTPFTTKK